MTEGHPTFVPAYTALAPIYDRAGFADYAAGSVERYLLYAHSLDWAGRKILDLGCGTGVSTWWLSGQGYRVTGIDDSAAMLEQAALREPGDGTLASQPEFMQLDLRALGSPPGPADLAMAIGGVLNAAHSLRELEATFAAVQRALEPERLFIFDMETIEGLAASAAQPVTVACDDELTLTVLCRQQFSFETLSRTTQISIWQQAGEGWMRADELHTARGYPVQAIRTVLSRAGLTPLAVLDETMTPVDPAQETPARVVFVAEKADDAG